MNDSPIPSASHETPCRRLRCKEMFYENPGQGEAACASEQYWCLQTHENYGPDGKPVGKTECCHSRGCFVG
jgi:hypothetical protein